MIFSKRITSVYKMQLFSRADDTGLIRYLSTDDFPGLHRKSYAFKAQAGHKLQGWFYHYHETAPGRLVIFDHGMGGGHTAYMREINMLAQKGYLVFAYDHTGCMDSEGENMNGFAQSLSDLDACIKALKADERYRDLTISVVGHSWGGFAAMNISALHPEVRHQIALSGFISVEQMLKQTFATGFTRLFLGDIRKIEQGANPLYFNYNAVDSLKKTEAQVLLIASDNDRAVRPDLHHNVLQEALADRSNVSVMMVEGRGHNPNYTLDAVQYKNEFFNQMQLLRHKRKLSKPEERKEFLDQWDLMRMTEQDPYVWEAIFATLEK